MRRPGWIYAIFILSGAAGLMYEVVWARQLVLVFGNTTQAVSAILTGFFGGMAIGSAFGGRIADRVARPLRLFGLLELALAAIVIATPVTFALIHEVYRSAFGTLQSNPALLTAVRYALSLAALGPATILMGATLPTLTRHLTGDSSRLSVAFGRLYAANTAGAIVGTIAAGFILIELLGLSRTLVAGAACSALAGAIALMIDRLGREEAVAPPPLEVIAPGNTSRFPTGLIIAISFVSGLTSLGYQVLWTRLLASGTGNSTYVFSAILALFLTGLAIGALGFGWYRRRIEDPLSFIAHGQLMIAILVFVGMITAISRQVTEFIGAGPGFADAFLGFVASVAIVVLPATIAMGLIFPAVAALADGRTGRVGTNAGTVLSANTAGAITATVAIPFLLIPAVGSPAAVGILALVNIAMAIALALRGGMKVRRDRRVVLSAGVVLAVMMGGALRTGWFFVDPSEVWVRSNGKLFESREDQIASVQAGEVIQRQLWVTGTSMTALTVDAKLMTVMPLILKPDAASVLVVAFGMGTSFRTALLVGLEADAVELVPSVPKMFRWFHADAESVLANPRGKVIISDGRNHMELTGKTYDIIITDPPPPIESAGVSVIASREYYEAGKRKLTPGGVMMQWIPYGQTVEEFKAHVRTYRSVFEHVIVAEGPARHGFLLLGATRPISFDDETVREVLSRPNVVADLAGSGDSPESTLDGWARLIPALVRLEGASVQAYTGEGPLITDDRPLPEYFLIRHLRGARKNLMRRTDSLTVGR